MAALAGTAVAGDRTASTSVSKKKTRSIAKKVVNKRIDKLAPGLSVDHAVSADSAISADTASSAETAETAERASNIYWAQVGSDGRLQHSSPGVISSRRNLEGWYHVRTNRARLNNCAFTASPFFGTSLGDLRTAQASSTILNGELGISVRIWGPNGEVDSSFSLVMACP